PRSSAKPRPSATTRRASGSRGLRGAWCSLARPSSRRSRAASDTRRRPGALPSKRRARAGVRVAAAEPARSLRSRRPSVASSQQRSRSRRLPTVDRPAALDLVREKTEKETTVRHLISVEGLMRRLGRHFGEDEDLWALAGLFHDLDQDQTHDDIERHGHLSAQWLREA